VTDVSWLPQTRGTRFLSSWTPPSRWKQKRCAPQGNALLRVGKTSFWVSQRLGNQNSSQNYVCTTGFNFSKEQTFPFYTSTRLLPWIKETQREANSRLNLINNAWTETPVPPLTPLTAQCSLKHMGECFFLSAQCADRPAIQACRRSCRINTANNSNEIVPPLELHERPFSDFFMHLFSSRPNVTVQWLETMLHIWKVPGSYLDSEIGFPVWVKFASKVRARTLPSVTFTFIIHYWFYGRRCIMAVPSEMEVWTAESI
jgi:hypothetical protein